MIEIATLLDDRVKAELRLVAANALLERAEAEVKAAGDAARAAHNDIQIALTAEINRLLAEAA